MKTFQVLRDLCALIVTAVVRWLSNVIRVPVAVCVLAVAAVTAWPVQHVFADAAVVYVNIDRPWIGQNPTEDGESWDTAYRFLQDGLTRGHQLLGGFDPPASVHIWVAQGTYRPDSTNTNSPTGCQDPYACCEPYGNCNYNTISGSFQTTAGPIHLLGGFPPDSHDDHEYGQGGAKEEHRNPSLYTTILDADLKGDDFFSASYDGNGNLVFTTVDPNTQINTFNDNVQKLFRANANTTIDGFTMRGALVHAIEAGVAVPVTLRESIVKENFDSALYFPDSNQVEIRNSKLFHNSGSTNPWSAGGVQMWNNGELTIIDSSITENLGYSAGGGSERNSKI